MHQVFFARSAQTDLLEAWLFIADQSIEAADHVMDVIEREAQTLALQPLMGRARPQCRHLTRLAMYSGLAQQVFIQQSLHCTISE